MYTIEQIHLNLIIDLEYHSCYCNIYDYTVNKQLYYISRLYTRYTYADTFLYS